MKSTTLERPPTNDCEPKRVLILGSPGSGKTTLARRLATQTKRPLVMLDDLFWLPGWVKQDRVEFEKQLSAKLSQFEWVMDGNDRPSLPQRLKRAHLVLELNVNRWVCAYRVLRRWLLQSREQAPGCPQRVDFEFLWYILQVYPHSELPKLDCIRRMHSEGTTWVVVSSIEEAITVYDCSTKTN